MRYYGNVMTTIKKQQQVQSTTVLYEDVWYIYNKLSIHIQLQKYSHVIDVFYIFNSTVVDWTFLF
jgi:hypothetical protein